MRPFIGHPTEGLNILLALLHHVIRAIRIKIHSTGPAGGRPDFFPQQKQLENFIDKSFHQTILIAEQETNLL